MISSQTSTLTRNLECPEAIKEVFREMEENDSNRSDTSSSSCDADGTEEARSTDTPTNTGGRHGVTIFVQSPAKRNSLANLEEEEDTDEEESDGEIPIYDEYMPHLEALQVDPICTNEVGTNTDGKYVGPLQRSTGNLHGAGHVMTEMESTITTANHVVKLEVNTEAEEIASTSVSPSSRPVKVSSKIVPILIRSANFKFSSVLAESQRQ